MAEEYDVLIVGGGLAGMTAGIYAARYGMRAAIVERLMGGAQIINIENIENYPGFPQGISGAELGPAVQEQALDAGVEFIMAEATAVTQRDDRLVVASDAGEHRAKAVVRGGRIESPPTGDPRRGGVCSDEAFPTAPPATARCTWDRWWG